VEREWSGNARRLSRADRAEIERRIRGGETFTTAAEAVGCSTKSIQRFLALTGGLKSRIKQRSPLRLSLADREELSRGLGAGDSLRAIASRLGRAPSTISREVAWSGRIGYRAWRADGEAVEAAVWFHDAVYDTRKADNEQSTELADGRIPLCRLTNV